MKDDNNSRKKLLKKIVDLTDKKIEETYSNYLNAETNNKLAEFAFSFKFDDTILEYKYGFVWAIS